MSIGTHCSLSECHQIDFLPFCCDACDRVFCLEHRTYSAHSCPKAGSKDASIIICPLCAKGIKLSLQQDPNAAFEQHTLQVMHCYCCKKGLCRLQAQFVV